MGETIARVLEEKRKWKSYKNQVRANERRGGVGGHIYV